MSATEATGQFYDHLNQCELCGCVDPFDPCEVGFELLYEAGKDLPQVWQAELRRLCARKQREKEADANFEYYKRM